MTHNRTMMGIKKRKKCFQKVKSFVVRAVASRIIYDERLPLTMLQEESLRAKDGGLRHIEQERHLMSRL